MSDFIYAPNSKLWCDNCREFSYWFAESYDEKGKPLDCRCLVCGCVICH